MPSPAPDANPLLQPWTGPFEAPPFAAIDPSHFEPAFEAAMAEHRAEVEAIATHPEAPSFANTVEAMERAGGAMDRVAGVFFNLTGADTNEALQATERAMAPLLSRHRTAIYLDERLYRRFADLHARADALGLTPEQARVLDRTHTAFVRAGAALAPEARERVAAIAERLATLGTAFGQNVLADERDWTMPLEPGDLDGLPEATVQAAAAAAAERGRPGHLVTLARSSVEPFLQFSARRDLRERAYAAWTTRGRKGGGTDNRAIVAEMVRLRAERARLMGYDSYAAFRLDDTMAGTPQAVSDLLASVWRPARAQALREREALAALMAEDGLNGPVEPWDWRYYAERRRRAEFDLDEAALKPYLPLERMIAAAFDVAHRLFGLSFAERTDLALYHEDVRAFEVTGPEGEPVGLFLADYFARPSKRSGAWMSAFRSQEKLAGDIRPIIVNVMNFNKGSNGEPALLGHDDARTLFHEFGHGLHGLLSDVTYPLLAGTGVARDFVEFPSQLYEHWLDERQVLGEHARHVTTGEPLPGPLLDRLLAARRFNQGFNTVEYLASALVDLDFHLLSEPGDIDVLAFEREVLDRLGLPPGTAMRHATTHFQHVFAGEGYSAGYYSYLWSEVLDADGFGAFEEAGDIFDPATADRLRRFVYAAGNTRDPAEAYRAFRGRAPDPAALLRQRGLEAVSPAA